MFPSLGAVCSVFVDLLADAANWIEDRQSYVDNQD